MDKYEIIIFILFVIIVGIVSIIIHNINSAFDYTRIIFKNGDIKTLPYDVILDCDSQRVVSLSMLFLEGIRHPLISILTSPDFIIAKIISAPFIRNEQITATVFSIFNVFKLAFSGLIIKRITNSKFSLVLFYVSFSTILYSLVLEYHTYAVFYLLLSIYINFNIHSNSFEKAFALFFSFSSNFIMIAIAPVIMELGSFKKYIKDCVLTGTIIVYYISLFGKLPTIVDIRRGTETDHIQKLSFFESFNKYSSFIKNGICNIKPIINEFTSFYIENTFSILGCIILILSIFVFIYYCKEKVVIISFFWILISIIVFPIIGFSYYSYSTHSVLFTWAFIIMISKFVQYLYDINVNKKVIFVLILLFLTFIIYTNFNTFCQLFRYSMKFNYLA